MRRLLSTAFAVVLLLGLAALAVLARPNDATQMAPARADSGVTTQTDSPAVIQPSGLKPMAPAAPSATQKYNAIGLPLDSSAQFSYNADGLANYIGASVQQVLRLDARRKAFDSWYPASQDGYIGGIYTETPFTLTVGGGYWVLLDSTSPTVLSFVGNVPAAGSVKFTFVGTSPTCSNNQITVPLDQAGITNADLLANSIGAANVDQVLRLNAARQGFDSWYPASQDGYVDGVYTETPFDVKIGYPYWICLLVGANDQVWP